MQINLFHNPENNFFPEQSDITKIPDSHTCTKGFVFNFSFDFIIKSICSMNYCF